MAAVSTLLDELLGAGPCVLETDVLVGLRALPSNSVDAFVTDPPYGLEFMGAEWDSFGGDAWRAGAGMVAPGIGDRPTAWPSFGGDSANATCSRCKGRMRGKKVCECPEPAWMVKGQPRQLQDSTYQTGHYGRNTAVRHGIGGSYGTEGAKNSRAFGEWCYQWAVEALRVAKPGAHILAFGGTRTSHRLVCALEDAGWEIRDELMYLYGSGFPKSTAIDKAIDKALGRDKDRAFKSVNPAQRPYNTAHGETSTGWKAPSRPDKTHPASPQALEWEGWGTAVKPGYEPIVVARKPLVSTVARNVLQYGTGGLNIDACRIRTDWETDPTRRGWQGGRRPQTRAFDSGDTTQPTVPRETPTVGRWPANVILGHSPSCVCTGTAKVKSKNAELKHTDAGSNPGSYDGGWKRQASGSYGHADPDGTETIETWECVEDCPVRILDAQSGVRPSTLTGRADPASSHPNEGKTESRGFAGVGGGVGSVYADKGGASRFFYSVKANSNDRWVAISCSEGCAFHGARMSRRAAKASATKPVRGARDGLCRSCGANRSHAGHPTVKPEGLMRYLVRLVTPPGGVVVDLFCGSGSTGVATVKEGFRFLGIDKTPEFVLLSRARLTDVLDKLSKNEPPVEEADQDEDEDEDEPDEEELEGED